MTAPFVDNSTHRHLYVRYCLHAQSYFHEHIARLHEPDVQVVFLHPDLSSLDLSRIDLTTSEILQTPEVFSPTSSFIGHRKLAIFLGGRSIIFVRPRQHPANSVQGCLGVWQDGSQAVSGCNHPQNSPFSMDHTARVQKCQSK
jgi:hypothetical protein